MRRTIAAAEVVGTAAIVAFSSTVAVAAPVTVAAPAIVVVAVSALVEEGIISTTRALTMFTAVRQAEGVPKFVIQGIAEQSGLWCTAIQVGSIIPGQAEDCTAEPGEPSLLASNWAYSAAKG